MKQKVFSFVTASLITVIVLGTLTVISTRSFLSDSDKEKGKAVVIGENLVVNKGVTDFFQHLLSFNRELFPSFVVDYTNYNVKKMSQVSSTALDLCMSAIEYAVGVK